mmetsp:Transcript_36157/g.34202  ORF Transcript_36157/g.34202 Transcript_36157/m.34202 type:complete len:138 (-) Transcript_36157:52-465(-)
MKFKIKKSEEEMKKSAINRLPISLGISKADENTKNLESNADLKSFKVFKGTSDCTDAAHASVNQQKLSDNKLRLSQQNLKLFTALTKQRVKIIDLPGEIGDDEIIESPNEISKTIFEEAVEKANRATSSFKSRMITG